MPITYEQLENRGGTIYNKATGKAYGEGLTKVEANKQVAADLGIQPHQIDWNKISEQTTNVPEKKSDLDGLSDQSLKIPIVDPFTGNAVDMTSGYSALGQFYGQQAADLAKQTEIVGKSQQEIMDELKEFQEGRKTKAELTTEAFKDIGIDAKSYFASLQAGYDEIGGLRDQYNNIEAEKNNALGVAENQLASKTYIRGEKAVIQTKYERRLSKINSDISAKAAVLQAKQGLFGEARQFIKEAVSSSIYDQEKEFEMLSKFVDMNQDILDGLGEDYKDAINAALDNSKKAYEEIKEEKETVGDLMIEYPEAGINMNMSKEEAINAAQSYLTTIGGVDVAEVDDVKEKILSINQIDQFRRSYGWTPPYGFTESQLLQFMKDNPNATPEELETGAKQALAGGAGVIEPVAELTADRNTIEGIKERVILARQEEYKDEEIKSTIKNLYTIDELFALAKSAGYAKWYTGKEKDINRMLNAILAQ